MTTDDENDRVPTREANGLILNRRIRDKTVKKKNQHDMIGLSASTLYMQARSPRKEIRGQRGFSPCSKIGESVKLNKTLSG